MYAEGCIFIDHTMGNVHIEQLLNFTSTTMIQENNAPNDEWAIWE